MPLVNKSMLFVYVTMVLMPSLEAENVNDVQSVLDSFFAPAKYNRRIRGMKDQTQPVIVNVTFVLTSIVALNEVEETFEFMGLLKMKWFDERLVWDPADYNDTRFVHVFQDSIWKPEILLANPSKNVALLGDERIMTTHYSNGTASWIVGDLFKAQCSLDVSAYPWDSQICFIELLVWGYSSEEVMLLATSDGAELQYYHGNGAWELISSKTTSSGIPNLSKVVFSFELRRYAMFSIVNVFIPILTLTALVLLAFFIPVSSGEKISYCITVLLALAVFTSIVSDHLPKHSKNMAHICLFLLNTLLMSSIICAGAVISVRLYHASDDTRPPLWLQRIMKVLSCKKRSSKISEANIPDSQPVDGQQKNNEVNENVKASEEQMDVEFKWQDASIFIDRVFFVVALIWLLIAVTVFVIFALGT